MNNEVTINQAISEIRQRLADKFSKGEIDGFVRIIFRQLMNYESVDILMHKDSILPDFIVEKIGKVIDRLLDDCPIQYIFGTAYFYGYDFGVNEHTLIPRPETEELVDLIVAENKGTDLKVFDAGTGSGCIAISLALNLTFAEVTAIDVSDGALQRAEQNAKDLKAKVTFKKQDILALQPEENSLDIIVSNPPYIIESEKETMESNVLDYEPSTALFVPNNDPLKFYRPLAEFGAVSLKNGGHIYFEINRAFSKEIVAMLEDLGYRDIDAIRDFYGNYRFVKATKIVD